ncbi:MAG: DJ-1/PfpI family protein [Nocardioidaceae bacterium]
MSSPPSQEVTPKRALLLIYDTFAEFEVSVLLTALSGTSHTVTTCSLTGDPVTSTGGLRVVPDVVVSEVDADDYDALIVPGGEASRLLGQASLQRLVGGLHQRGRLIAAICGGPAVLGDAGVLDGRSFTAALGPQDPAWPGVADRGTRLAEMVVVDGNLVTATGSSYLAFAEEVLRLLDDRPDVAPLTFFREPSLA